MHRILDFLWRGRQRGQAPYLIWIGLLTGCLCSCFSVSQPRALTTLSPPGTIPVVRPPTRVWLPLVQHDADTTVTSPNGKLRLRLFVDAAPPSPPLSYTLTDADHLIIRNSALTLQLPAQEAPLDQLAITQVDYNTVDQHYAVSLGEAAIVQDQYHELVVHLQEQAGLHRALQVIVRLYDEAVAFRYHIPSQSAWPIVTIQAEQTHFAFTADYLAYVEYGTEGGYQPQPLSALTGRSETPLTLLDSQGRALAITEAAVANYPRMVLTRHATEPQTLVTSLESMAQAATPYSTPWRVIMIATSPAALLAQSDLLYKLSPPATFADTSWIRPGQAMRSKLSTEAAEETIDFAAAHGIEYIEFDAGWYGLGYHAEFDPNSDATQVIAAIDMPRVLDYATQRGRGVILYVNRIALERQLDTLLPLYASWGVQGIKLGFMDGRTQAGIRFIHEIVQKAATYQLLVDVHDSYRPSGLSRTYPNLLTQEGIRGNEHYPGATHNVTLPFTRFLAGAADYTFPYYSNQVTTRAHQLGAKIAFFSPLQFVLWYDTPHQAQGEPELALIGALPTVWDETVIVDGQIGNTVTIARRKGQVWFVGTLTNDEARTVKIPLTFLDPHQQYTAYHYQDQTPTQVAINRSTVSAADTISADLLPSGGHVLYLAPAPIAE